MSWSARLSSARWRASGGIELAGAGGPEGGGVECSGAGLGCLVGGGGELSTFVGTGPQGDGEPADEHDDHRDTEHQQGDRTAVVAGTAGVMVRVMEA